MACDDNEAAACYRPTMADDPFSPDTLPLFPLGSVLFPGGLLPLQVFEVRYLDMIGRCRRAGQPFGVVALAQGHEVRRPGAAEEQLHAVGTLARITRLEQAQPGLLLIECRGEQRFRIEQASQLKHGLWVATFSLLPPDPAVSVPEHLRHAADALRRIHDGLRTNGSALALPPADAADYGDCAWVANRWCELLPLPLATRQQLMALDNPLLRLELAADLLARAGINAGSA